MITGSEEIKLGRRQGVEHTCIYKPFVVGNRGNHNIVGNYIKIFFL